MKAIRLTYRYSEVDPSVSLLLYFRMVGVYVSERFLNKKDNLKEEINNLKFDFEKILEEDVSPYFDADIFLVSSSADYEEYKRLRENRHILVRCGDVNVDENEREKCVNCPDLTTVTESQRNIVRGDLIENILSALLDASILSREEYEDCLDVAKAYSSQHYMGTTLSTKYFFSANEDPSYQGKKNAYRNVVNELTNLLEQKKWNKWGESAWEHLQFAILNTAYEANLYSKRSGKANIYTTKSLLEVGQELEGNFNSFLEGSVAVLLGQINMDLLGNANKAYQYYTRGCELRKGYDAYVFLLKGQYWQNSVGDHKKATQYYYRSILTFPEYYRAWYKLGYCYYKLGEKEKSLCAFDAVKKILLQRLEAKSIRPMEIEHLFHACNQCAGIIYEKHADAEWAIKYHQIAERAWSGIEKSRFIDMVGNDEQERKSLRVRTQKNLDIGKVYRQMAVLSRRCGKDEEARRYEEQALKHS